MADEQRPSPVAKTEVWTLGLLGVNVVDGPLHLVDGELLTAQNAEPFMEEGEGGIRKRLGIALFTPDQLAAGISAITSIPLPDPYQPLPDTGDRLHAPTTTDGGTPDFYLFSDDGITWDADSNIIPERPGAPLGGLGGPANQIFQHGGFLTTEEGMFFLNGSAGQLVKWDGTALTEMTSNNADDIAGGMQCHTFLVHLGEIYALMLTGTTVQLVKFNGSAWEDASGSRASMPEAIVAASAWGRIYVPNEDHEMHYWSADSGWVNDGVYDAGAGDLQPTDMINTPWGLVVSHARNSATGGLVQLKPGPDDAFEDLTDPTADTGCYGPMVLLDDVLYVGRANDQGATFTGCEIWKYDGSTFTLEKDLTDLQATHNELLSLVAFNGALYATVRASANPSRNIVRRASNGTWSLVVEEDDISQDGPRGSIGFL